MLQKVCFKGLWVSTIVVLLITALQILSGNWIAFFLLWPGGPHFGQAFVHILTGLPGYHIKAGFAVGAFSVLILFFAFLSKSNIFTRIFAVVGLIIVVLAVSGGFLFVTSSFQDRLSLGQMADASVGVFAAYFLQLIFMFKTLGFLNKPAKSGR